MVFLIHTTLRSNLASIRRTGLDPNRSRGAYKSVWLTTRKRMSEKRAYLAKRDGEPLDAYVYLICEVDFSQIIRAGNGHFRYNDLIRPENIHCWESVAWCDTISYSGSFQGERIFV